MEIFPWIQQVVEMFSELNEEKTHPRVPGYSQGQPIKAAIKLEAIESSGSDFVQQSKHI